VGEGRWYNFKVRYQIKPFPLIISALLGGLTWFFSNNFSTGVAVFALALTPWLIGLYIPYAKDNPKHFWFKRKLYGWGWAPVTWQGWLITFLYVGLVAVCSLTIDKSSSNSEKAFRFGLPTLFLTVAFIRTAYLKGEKPKWQWGRK
jgi:hypothetical protein